MEGWGQLRTRMKHFSECLTKEAAANCLPQHWQSKTSPTPCSPPAFSAAASSSASCAQPSPPSAKGLCLPNSPVDRKATPVRLCLCLCGGGRACLGDVYELVCQDGLLELSPTALEEVQLLAQILRLRLDRSEVRQVVRVRPRDGAAQPCPRPVSKRSRAVRSRPANAS